MEIGEGSMRQLGACALEYNSVMPLVGGRSLHPSNCKRRNQFLIKGKGTHGEGSKD